METKEISKFTLTPKEAGSYLGISENKIRTLCKDGIIKAARSGRNWKIPRPCLEEYAMRVAEEGGEL